MAWPPPLPPNTRTNATQLLDLHAQDHNQIVVALSALLTNAAYGLVAQQAVAVSGPTTGTTFVDLPGSSVTWTPMVGRRYKLSATGLGVCNTAGGQFAVRISDSSAQTWGECDVLASIANIGISFYVVCYIVPSTATPLTHKLTYRQQSGAGLTYLYADSGVQGQTRLYIEDAGPTTPVVP